MHLTDEQLNEYLDHESDERAQVEAHLYSCEACTARLTVLKTLFTEIESLPEIPLSRSLAPRVAPQAPSLPRWLTLAAAGQAAFAVIALIAAAPLIMPLISPYFYGVQVPSSAGIFLELQSLWLGWLDRIPQLQSPSLPSIPVVEVSSFVIVFTLVGVSALWLIGNGLLLRNEIK